MPRFGTVLFDLDGTLVTRDTIGQLVGEMARRAPHRAHRAIGEFRRSQAHGRHFLWQEVGLDPARLHYSPSVVAYLRQQ